MKKFGAFLLAGVLAIGALTGCGSTDKKAESSTGSTDTQVIKVAASATPHAEILEEAKPLLAKEGYDLQVTVFDDYVQPNEVVDSGDFDANYFQHVPVPNDTTNEARALLLLQDNGLIKLKDGAGLTATVNDIAENPHNIKIVELEAAQVARVTGETAFVVLNGNYALQAGYSVKKDALAYEASDSEAAKTYVNIIAVKEGNEDSDAIKALVKVLKSDDIKKFIDEKYDGAVIAFE